MTKKHFSDDKLDSLLRAALMDEEAPPPAIQTELIENLRRNNVRLEIPWWLLPAIGSMQTVTFVVAVYLLLPGSQFTHFVMFGGACVILCSVVLSVLIRKTWLKKKEVICL